MYNDIFFETSPPPPPPPPPLHFLAPTLSTSLKDDTNDTIPFPRLFLTAQTRVAPASHPLFTAGGGRKDGGEEK